MVKAKMSQAEWDNLLKQNPKLANQFGNAVTKDSPVVKVSRKKKYQYDEPIGPKKPPTLRERIKGGIVAFNRDVVPALKSARETIIKVRDEGVFAGDGHSSGGAPVYYSNLANLGNDWLPAGPNGKTRKNHHDLVPSPQMMTNPGAIGSDVANLGFGVGGFGEEPRIRENHKKHPGTTVHIHHHYHNR